MSNREDTSVQTLERAGGTTYPIWPGNHLGSPRCSWRTWPERSMSAVPCLTCFYHDAGPGKCSQNQWGSLSDKCTASVAQMKLMKSQFRGTGGRTERAKWVLSAVFEQIWGYFVFAPARSLHHQKESAALPCVDKAQAQVEPALWRIIPSDGEGRGHISCTHQCACT